ncbi:unnamed protein product [Lactuca virosa]|uniref:Uncharacterized protein n=1 Tax=Lactuca virosa TaxID=75947 RepID=A0AAU9PEB9_9ASTR|nr:unnamed protein product [Lactuca virosa]
MSVIKEVSNPWICFRVSNTCTLSYVELFQDSGFCVTRHVVVGFIGDGREITPTTYLLTELVMWHWFIEPISGLAMNG